MLIGFLSTPVPRNPLTVRYVLSDFKRHILVYYLVKKKREVGRRTVIHLPLGALEGQVGKRGAAFSHAVR